MGLDLILAVRTKKLRSKKELQELNYRFMEASSLGYGKSPIKIEEVHDSHNYYYQIETMSRYYGEHYARGHFPKIYAAVRWLRCNFPEGEILYGSDNNYLEEMEALTVEDQEKMMEFWCKSGGLTYRNRTPEKENFKRLCPNCDVIMSQYMWSGGNGAINCLGCKYTEETKDGGLTWIEITRI